MLIIRWNWKASLLSGLVRASIFLLMTHKYGWHAATLAAAVEALYSAGTAGIFAGMVQTVRRWRPVWLATLAIAVGLPLISQSSDYAVHLMLHTPNLRACIRVSIVFSALGMVFTWFSMDRGTFLVGGEHPTLLEDVGSLPRLIVQFLAAPVAWALSRPQWDGSAPLMHQPLHSPGEKPCEYPLSDTL